MEQQLDTYLSLYLGGYIGNVSNGFLLLSYSSCSPVMYDLIGPPAPTDRSSLPVNVDNILVCRVGSMPLPYIPSLVGPSWWVVWVYW